MASIDIAQLADALSKTHVDDAELSFKGLGLKLDNAASGQMVKTFFFFVYTMLVLCCCKHQRAGTYFLSVSPLVFCAFSEGDSS